MKRKFLVCSVVGLSTFVNAAGKTFHMYDENPMGSGDHATVQKVAPGQYNVQIQPTEAQVGVGVYGGTVEANNRWAAVQKVDNTFETGKPGKK